MEENDRERIQEGGNHNDGEIKANAWNKHMRKTKTI